MAHRSIWLDNRLGCWLDECRRMPACILSPQVTEAVRIAKELRPELALDGPMQYDAAVDPIIAQQKVRDTSLSGQYHVASPCMHVSAGRACEWLQTLRSTVASTSIGIQA